MEALEELAAHLHKSSELLGRLDPFSGRDYAELADKVIYFLPQIHVEEVDIWIRITTCSTTVMR